MGLVGLWHSVCGSRNNAAKSGDQESDWWFDYDCSSGNFEVVGRFIKEGKESCKGGDDSGIMGFRYRIF